MDTITFSDISIENAGALQNVFSVIKAGKENGAIDESLVRDALGGHVARFVSDENVIQELLEKWQKDRTTPLPWEFGSWIDALMRCELRFCSLLVRSDGSGDLYFEQLAWPSGGLDATEEIIKVFGGRIVLNTAA